MAEFGYSLSSEEHPPGALVEMAQRAEDVGFDFATISDHFHPWTDTQGQSPFVWAVIGGVAEATSRLRLGTAVTCPSKRIHPAIVAQAAATAEAMMPGRFFLGVGSGENLNEHIVGEPWPPTDIRLEMLEEAVEMIRELFTGRIVTREGRHHRVHNARIYTLPANPPPVMVAAAGPKASQLAGRIGDGLISTAPRPETTDDFRDAGGEGKPCYGQLHVCVDSDESRARQRASRLWPNAGIPGELSQELPMPAHFEQAAGAVSEDQVAETVVCGDDPDRHVAAVRAFLDAGFDHVTIHQVGPDQESFFSFYESEVLPKLR